MTSIVHNLQYFLMESKADEVMYRFVKEKELMADEALYLIGSAKALGEWNLDKAIPLRLKHHTYWITSLSLPIDLVIKYKYFVGSSQRKSQSASNVKWLGEQQSLLIDEQQSHHFLQNDAQILSLMSFNVRFQTPKDKKQFSWTRRKDNCIQLIRNHYPDIIGLQEPTRNQQAFLQENIKHYYKYYGTIKDLQSNGIFIRKDKFIVIDDGQVWINEKKIPEQEGFKASLPRHFTYIVVVSLIENAQPFIVINTHLDHKSNQSRLEGIKYISETLSVKSKEHNFKTHNCFVMGDFNVTDDSQIFQDLQLNGQHLRSMRYALPEQQCNFTSTFKSFSKVQDSGFILDHIFTKCLNYTPVSLTRALLENKIVSDHYPIIGYFQIGNLAI